MRGWRSLFKVGLDQLLYWGGILTLNRLLVKSLGEGNLLFILFRVVNLWLIVSELEDSFLDVSILIFNR